MATVQAAADASVTLGSGSGALTVTSSSNTVNTAINGVTLNLLATTPASQPVQVTVANDTSTAPDGHPELRHRLQQRHQHHRQ